MKILKKPLNVILAHTRKYGIGKNNTLPWNNLSTDLKFFKKATSFTTDKKQQNSIIMGFNTFTSLNNKPLPNRQNIVITTKPAHQTDQYKKENLHFFNSLEQALQFTENHPQIHQNFICGGTKIFNSVFEDYLNDKLNINQLF